MGNKKKKREKREALTFRNALKHERLDFGQVKPYVQTHKTEKDYDRRKRKQTDRKLISEES